MEHVSNLTLERLCVDELPAQERASVEAHVKECARCAGFVSETQALVVEDLRAHPTASFLNSVEQVKSRRVWPTSWKIQWLAPAFAMAAAAIAILIVAPRGAEDVTFKGAPLSVHRYRADASTVLSTGDAVRVGDRVEIRMPSLGEVSFVPEHGDAVALKSSESGGAMSAWFIMEAPCTPGWIVFHRLPAKDRRVRLECER
jgi:anti-sigma factor RsiW